MKGCRPLTDDEAQAVFEALGKNLHASRDRALFVLGERTGFRISELLSLRVGDVWQHGRIPDEIAVARQYMKKKREGRKVLLHEKAKEALQIWLEKLGTQNPARFLFPSSQAGNKPLNRRTAWQMLKKAYAACGFTGKLATHTMRKIFAKRMLKNTGGDLIALQKLMGHADINSTVQYIEVDEEKMRSAILKS